MRVHLLAVPNPLTVDQAARQIQRLLPPRSDDRTLEHYRRVGEIVSRLDFSYGQQSVERLDTALRALGVPGLRFSMLHKTKRVFNNVDAATVRRLESRGVNWRDLANLLSKNIADARRRELLDQVLSGDLDPKQLGRKISSAVGVRRYANNKALFAAERAAERALTQLQGVLTHARDEDAHEAGVHIARELQKRLEELLHRADTLTRMQQRVKRSRVE